MPSMKKGTYIDIDGGNLDVCNKCVQKKQKEQKMKVSPEMAKPEKPTARTRNVMATPFV